jgi:hypothetical protein
MVLQFVRVNQALLDILISKAGLCSSMPMVGPPIAQQLRSIDTVFDVSIRSCEALVYTCTYFIYRRWGLCLSTRFKVGQLICSPKPKTFRRRLRRPCRRTSSCRWAVCEPKLRLHVALLHVVRQLFKLCEIRVSSYPQTQ